MRLPKSLLAVLTLLTTGVATAGLTVTGAATAQAATPLPTHVFAPYFEAWTGDSPATLAQQSGAKYLTMAFIQAATKGSCTVYWNGDSSLPIASSSFGNDINTIRSNGGDVIPSFGGYTADNTGTEIADSCTDVNQIAAAYEKAITTYDVSRLDFDIEDNSLTNSGGIDRRNKAMKIVEDWAAGNGRSVQFSYTLPTNTSGLADSGLAVLRSAVSNNARVDVVNMMTFDYYDGSTHNMAADTQTSAQGLYDQLAGLYPGKSPAQLWGSIGITEMIGIDDFGAAETFTTADATTVYNWAVSKGINELSFWALQRDNGSCPGTKGSDSCSGVAQSTWQFSQTFEPFTNGSTPTNDFSVSLGAGSGTVNAGASTTVAVNTAVTTGTAQTVNLTVAGAPSGVTATVSPTSVTAGGSATLTLAAASSVPSGTYPITVTGKAGATSHSASYSLTVKGSTPTNDFSVTLSPTTGAVNAGASTTSTVRTAVTSGTAQTVTLTTSGAPAGVTASVSPTSVTAGGSATLTLNAAATTASGTYAVIVTGTAGSTTHSATFSLTVIGSTPPGTVTNGGFESGSLSPWTGQPGDVVVSSPAHSGGHAVQVTPTSSQTGEVDQTVTLAPNHSYTLTAWVQGNYAYVGVSGGASASGWTSSTGWAQLTVPFTTGSSGTVTVYAHGWYAQGNVYADDFDIK
ncbi:hypothetical protein F0L68_16010 [Solihabitans fulvus]|uniref:chitinase n=1 Tax=Solihabitans fulvus TaxID=1892852 RepID=A0A5B2XE11_9PSEU|nr:glycosyl hydrolase family 18 protein [Solihabitans fulvus]KAA2261583.1 hypothetical protein F0L68_16010 [Solihabitans fulvus]